MLTKVQALQPFIIPNGTAVSNAIDAKGGINGNMMVYGRDPTDGAITYKYQASPDKISWYDLVDSAAAAVIPPLQGKCKTVSDVVVWLRIASSGNVTADRHWDVSAET